MGPRIIFNAALLVCTLLRMAQGQSSENALQTMEDYVTNGQAFIKLKGKHIRLYESPDAEPLEALPILYWLGPPKVLRNDVNGSDSKILNVVAHALQYDSDHSLNSSLAQGATITGQGTFTVLGFSATWNGDTGYSYVLADFDDHTQATFSDKLAFADANGDYQYVHSSQCC